jgi:membrane protein required for colicin V production
MDFQMIDMVIVGVVLFLAIKGLVNGFSKELFNFLGLIGGIAVAARVNEMVGDLIIKQNILPEMFTQYQKIIGFVVIFLAIWIIFNLISSLFSGFTSEEISIVSRILGYIVGIARYALIFALIIFGFNNADFLKEKFSKYTQKSQIFIPMSMVGEKLLNRDANQTFLSESNATKVDVNLTQNIENNVTKENNISQ